MGLTVLVMGRKLEGQVELISEDRALVRGI
jgi:hypothetical protein